VVVTAEVDPTRPDFGSVRIDGLGGRPEHRVRIVAGRTFDSTAPALAGDWSAGGRAAVFRPRYRPAAGLSLWVRVDTVSSRGAPPLVQRFDLPARATADSGRITVAIFPGADSLPENLLRWYLRFSTPMHRGDALAHLELVDDQGRLVRNAFLDLAEELWDPSGTRLTVLFDPGRVKRGIRTNLESGRPLVAGRRYALRIGAGWRDRRGLALGHPVEHRFVAVDADYRGPDPTAWTISPPRIGTVEPLQLGFGEPLDHALAERLIAIVDEGSRPVSGSVTLTPGDTGWWFTPATPWLGARYGIRVSPELEDPAGNRPGRSFDRALDSTTAPTERFATRWFVPRSASDPDREPIPAR
jgi:hypothetical protein